MKIKVVQNFKANRMVAVRGLNSAGKCLNEHLLPSLCTLRLTLCRFCACSEGLRGGRVEHENQSCAEFQGKSNGGSPRF